MQIRPLNRHYGHIAKPKSLQIDRALEEIAPIPVHRHLPHYLLSGSLLIPGKDLRVLGHSHRGDVNHTRIEVLDGADERKSRFVHNQDLGDDVVKIAHFWDARESEAVGPLEPRQAVSKEACRHDVVGGVDYLDRDDPVEGLVVQRGDGLEVERRGENSSVCVDGVAGEDVLSAEGASVDRIVAGDGCDVVDAGERGLDCCALVADD